MIDAFRRQDHGGDDGRINRWRDVDTTVILNVRIDGVICSIPKEQTELTGVAFDQFNAFAIWKYRARGRDQTEFLYQGE